MLSARGPLCGGPGGQKKVFEKSEKMLDKWKKNDIIYLVRVRAPPPAEGQKNRNTAGLCKGSTTDSDSVCEGSNPSPAAKKGLKSFDFRPFFYPWKAALSRVFFSLSSGGYSRPFRPSTAMTSSRFMGRSGAEPSTTPFAMAFCQCFSVLLQSGSGRVAA